MVIKKAFVLSVVLNIMVDKGSLLSCAVVVAVVVVVVVVVVVMRKKCVQAQCQRWRIEISHTGMR